MESFSFFVCTEAPADGWRFCIGPPDLSSVAGVMDSQAL